jgi:uncharacterized membrane protein YiaA
MNVIGGICAIIFLGAGVFGLAFFFYVTLYEAPRVKDRIADAAERDKEYDRIYRRRNTVFSLSWLVGALAFVVGAWIGGWNINQ